MIELKRTEDLLIGDWQVLCFSMSKIKKYLNAYDAVGWIPIALSGGSFEVSKAIGSYKIL